MHIEGFNCRNFLDFQGLGAVYTTFRVLIKHTSLLTKGLKTIQRNISRGFLSGELADLYMHDMTCTPSFEKNTFGGLMTHSRYRDFMVLNIDISEFETRKFPHIPDESRRTRGTSPLKSA